MSWAGKSHPLEVLAGWGAPFVLAAASAWAANIAGVSPTLVAAGFAAALIFGIGAIRLAGLTPAAAEAGFEPVPFSENLEGELLLDDPLVDVDADSRVVQLFAYPEPTPGELVLRISDYLNDSDRVAVADLPPQEQRHPDASAALHSALANIRASLR